MEEWRNKKRDNRMATFIFIFVLIILNSAIFVPPSDNTFLRISLKFAT